jgi:hypothetical protein
MGIVAVAGMPETPINLNFGGFFFFCLALGGYHLHQYITFVNCNTIIVFLQTVLVTWRSIELLAACVCVAIFVLES